MREGGEGKVGRSQKELMVSLPLFKSILGCFFQISVFSYCVVLCCFVLICFRDFDAEDRYVSHSSSLPFPIQCLPLRYFLDSLEAGSYPILSWTI